MTEPTHAPEATALPTFGLRSMLYLLAEHASPHLSTKELQWLSNNAPWMAASLSRQLEELTEGMGCLVSDDTNAGSFQDANSLFGLMFFISNQAGLLAGLQQLAETVEVRLNVAQR